MTRLIWASTKHKQLCGHSYKAADFVGKYKKGTIFQFEPAEKSVALELFDSVAENPGNFSIETRDYSKIDFLFGPTWISSIVKLFRKEIRRSVTLDIWFEEDPEIPIQDVVSLDIVKARGFLERIFDDVSDEELWRQLRKLTQ